MKEVSLLLLMGCRLIFAKEISVECCGDNKVSGSQRTLYEYAVPVLPFSSEDNHYKHKYYTAYEESPHLTATASSNRHNSPLLDALLISSILNLPAKPTKPNHPELLPINPFIALLLSQYGRYIPLHGSGRGIYAYAAANNFHNNQPIGSYKIYEDE